VAGVVVVVVVVAGFVVVVVVAAEHPQIEHVTVTSEHAFLTHA
jgi:hypothetical protein